jgi:hypothetical protein
MFGLFLYISISNSKNRRQQDEERSILGKLHNDATDFKCQCKTNHKCRIVRIVVAIRAGLFREHSSNRSSSISNNSIISRKSVTSLRPKSSNTLDR